MHRIPCRFVLAAVLASTACAQEVTFTKIADGDTPVPKWNGTFGESVAEQIGDAAIDGDAIVFSSNLSANKGYYIWRDDKLDVIIDSRTRLPGDVGTMLNQVSPPLASDGRVVFTTKGTKEPFGHSLYSWSSGKLLRITTPALAQLPKEAQARRDPKSPPIINVGYPWPDGQRTAYLLRHSGKVPYLAIYCTIGTRVQLVADNMTTKSPSNGKPFTLLEDPAVDGERVYFAAATAGEAGGDGAYGVYAFDGKSLSVIADFNTDVPGGGKFTRFTDAQADGGKVCFYAHGKKSNGERQAGVYMYDGAALRVVSNFDTAMPGPNPKLLGGRDARTDGHRVLFCGARSNTPREHTAVFLWDDGKIINILDSDVGPFQGKKAAYVRLGRKALSGDKAVLSVIFADDSKGIYLAHLPPAGTRPATSPTTRAAQP